MNGSLESARLLIDAPADSGAADLLRRAEVRKAEWEAARTCGKNPPARNGAGKKLRQLEPLLPVLRAEAEIAWLEKEADAGLAKLGTRKHEVQLRGEKLGGLINGLPEGDERTILLRRHAEAFGTLFAASAGEPPKARPLQAPVAVAGPPAAADRDREASVQLNQESSAEERETAEPGPEWGDRTEVIVLPPTLETGEVLKLLPRAGGAAPPLHFVARAQFVLGRFPVTVGRPVVADLSCPLQLNKVSRRHAILSLLGRQIRVQDAATPDHPTNGVWIGHQRIKPEPMPVNLASPQQMVLGLGPVFVLQAHHLAGNAPEGPPGVALKGFPAGPNAAALAGLSGCVRFSPQPAARMPVEAVWLFTDATIGADAASAVVLPPPLPARICRVHHWRGAFWFERLAPDPSVRLRPKSPGRLSATAGDELLPPPGEAVPLHTGDELCLGPLSYSVAIEPARS